MSIISLQNNSIQTLGEGVLGSKVVSSWKHFHFAAFLPDSLVFPRYRIKTLFLFTKYHLELSYSLLAVLGVALRKGT